MSAGAPDEAVISQRLAAAGFALPEERVAALAEFLALLMRWSRVHNLTAIRDPETAIERLLLESLALAPLLRGAEIADIGTGAGVPGMPLAIAEPDRRFTLIESRAKRVHFLRHAVGELGLANVTVAHTRAEDLRPARPFATVLARAVAPPAELLELARPLLGPGGVLVVSTTERLAAELGARGQALGLRLVHSGAVPHVQGAVVVLERLATSGP